MNCGEYVPWNTSHNCKTMTIEVPSFSTGAPMSYNIYDEIDRLKKRISDLEDEVRRLKVK